MDGPLWTKLHQNNREVGKCNKEESRTDQIEVYYFDRLLLETIMHISSFINRFVGLSPLIKRNLGCFKEGELKQFESDPAAYRTHGLTVP